MEFNQAIGLRERQKYAEGSALAPARDDRNNAFLWKRGVQHSEQNHEVTQALQKVSREVAKMKRRIVGGFVPTKTQNIQPLCFYNTSNVSNAIDGLGKPAANWLVFQMRDGFVSGRSIWSAESLFVNSIISFQQLVIGNYEILNPVFNDGQIGDMFSQPSAIGYAGFKLLDSLADTSLFDPATPNNPPTCGQIILNNAVTEPNGDMQASFWIEIIDTQSSPSGFYAKLLGRMFSTMGTGGRQVNPFPNSSPSIIPLCVIVSNAVLDTPAINQIQCGNLVNRYAGMVGLNGLGIFRGDYTADNLNNQYFYPGDWVTNGSFATGAHNISLKYLCTQYGQLAAPPSAGWKAIDS